MPQSKADLDLLRESRERFENVYDHEKDDRIDQLDDLKFKAGEQWPENIARKRDQDKRPMITIDRTSGAVRQVTGDVRLNTPAIKVSPVGDGADEDIAKIYQGLIRDVETSSNAKMAYITALDNAATCGIGWFRIVTKFTDDSSFDQDIGFQRIKSPFAVWCDPNANEIDKSDANYLFVTELIPKEEYERRWPNAAIVEFDSKEETDTSLFHWLEDDQVRIAEYWRKVRVKKRIYEMEDGSIVDQETFKELERLGFESVRDREVDSHQVEMWKISGAEVLEAKKVWPGKFFPFVPVVGEEVHVGDKTVTRGLVRPAKDPQRAYNYWRSAGIEMIALAPKAKWLLTTSQIQGQEAAWRDAHTDNNPYLLYTPDPEAGGIPQRTPGADVPVAMFQEASIAADDIKAATGIFDASLGAGSQEKSGKAIIARERQGDIGTFVYIDNLAMAIRHGGVILVDLIPKIYDGTRIIRTLGEDDAEEMIVINKPIQDVQGAIQAVENDMTIGRFDVRVSTGPSFSTKRAEASETMMEFVAKAPGAAPVVLDLIAKNMDWPGADEISERLRKTLPPGIAEVEEGEEDPAQQQAEQAAQQAAEAQIAAAQAEQAKAEAQTAEIIAKTEKLRSEAEGIDADTAQKQIELILQSGVFRNTIEQIVASAIADQTFQPPTGALPGAEFVPGER
jgi:hypothetical protein